MSETIDPGAEKFSEENHPGPSSTCIFEQMPVSELAVMVQGCRQLQSGGRA